MKKTTNVFMIITGAIPFVLGSFGVFLLSKSERHKNSRGFVECGCSH